MTKPLIITRYRCYIGAKASAKSKLVTVPGHLERSHSVVNGGISQEKILLSSTGRSEGNSLKGNSPGTRVGHESLWRETRSCLAVRPCPFSFLFLQGRGRLWCASASTGSFLRLFPSRCDGSNDTMESSGCYKPVFSHDALLACDQPLWQPYANNCISQRPGDGKVSP